MGDACFFTRSGPGPLADIASAAVGTVPAITRMFAGVAPLQSVGPDGVSGLDNRRCTAALEQTMASAIIVHPQMQPRVSGSAMAIVKPRAVRDGRMLPRRFVPCRPPRPAIHSSAPVDLVAGFLSRSAAKLLWRRPASFPIPLLVQCCSAVRSDRALSFFDS